MDGTEKKPSNKKVFIIAGVIVVIALAMLIGAFYLLGRPKTILLQGVTKLSTEINKSLELGNKDFYKKLANEDVVTLEGSMTLEAQALLGTNFGFNYSYTENKKEQKAAFNFDFLSGKESIIGANFVSTKDAGYLKLKKFMDIYYSIPNEFISIFENSDTSSYRKVVRLFADNLKEEIKEKDLKTSKQEITIDGKKTSTKTISYEITTEKIYNILNATCKDIQSDKALLKDLAKLANVTEKEFQAQMDSFLTSLKEEVATDDASLIYTVYYTGFNRVVMHSFTIEDISLEYYNHNDVQNVRILTGKQVAINLLVKKEKQVYNINLEMSNGSKITGTVEEEKENSYKYNFKIESGSTLSIKGTLVEKYEKDVYKMETTVKLEEGGITFPFTFNTEIKFSGNVDTKGTENAKPLAEMTSEEQQALMMKIMEDPTIGPLLQLFMSSTNPTY